jgi:hypothetical protein
VTPRPHDALFRSAFEHPDHAAAELRHVLPRTITDAIDWPTLHHEPGSFIDRALADRHSDLLFSARIGAAQALIYLLLEHQSTTDPRMPFRMLVYIVRVWERWLEETRDPASPHRASNARTLPLIIPVLLTHAPHGWTEPTRMHELFDPLSLAVPDVAELVPSFRIVVDDLAHVDDDGLRARAMATFPMLALRLLQAGHDAVELLRLLDRWAAAFAEVAAAPTGLHAFEKLMRYVELRLSPQKFLRFRARLKRLAPTTEDPMMRYSEQLIAEGRAEGKTEGQRDTLLKLLTLKFGTLDEPASARIHAASPAELERWIERILPATHLSAVFAD